MAPYPVIFLHGFASSAQGTKARYLRARFAARPEFAFHAIDFNPTPRDFEWLTVTGMINRLRQFILDRALGRVTLIGSSMGGLVGLNYAHRFGEVDRLLLLAPALVYLSGLRTNEAEAEWRERASGDVFHYAFERPVPLRYDLQVDGCLYAESPAPPAPITIVHGRGDATIPIQQSRDYAARYPQQVTLHEFESDHTLNDRLDAIWTILTEQLSTNLPGRD